MAATSDDENAVVGILRPTFHAVDALKRKECTWEEVEALIAEFQRPLSLLVSQDR